MEWVAHRARIIARLQPLFSLNTQTYYRLSLIAASAKVICLHQFNAIVLFILFIGP